MQNGRASKRRPYTSGPTEYRQWPYTSKRLWIPSMSRVILIASACLLLGSCTKQPTRSPELANSAKEQTHTYR